MKLLSNDKKEVVAMDYKSLLSELKKRLDQELPGKTERVILFGSRATGDEHEDSDFDILVILRDDFDWQTKDFIYDLCYELDLAHSMVSDVRVISKTELAGVRGKQPYVLNALQSGVSV